MLSNLDRLMVSHAETHANEIKKLCRHIKNASNRTKSLHPIVTFRANVKQ